MSDKLQLSVGHCSDKGPKAVNQDFHAVALPAEPLLSSKGALIALADGISSSGVSQEASRTAVNGLLQDYYSTSESWSVKNSVQRVLHATNSWLYAQTRNGPYRYDIDKGYVCTIAALVIKSNTAHLFHAGDTRIYRLLGGALEQLTEDHRLLVSREKSYLSRALGMRERLDLDYSAHAVEVGDTFVLATDGVYEFCPNTFIAQAITEHAHDLEQAARRIVDEALQRGGDDNLTVQLVRIDALPQQGIGEMQRQATRLPLPPELRPRVVFDGYEIVRELHHSSRSHLYLALDQQSGDRVALKVPSVDLSQDDAYLERFMMEEWVARRIDNVHIVSPCAVTRKRNYLYIVTEYIEGRTLAQWMRDHPSPALETVRDIVEQIARGLRALHRQEMLHQDLRPENIMLDANGTVKLIDFGSVRVAGLSESNALHEQPHILGTAQYTAPEYYIGEDGDNRSDLFSLAVITYQMLCGQLPYGPGVARATSRAAQLKLNYQSLLDHDRSRPAWVDECLRKALRVNPQQRYMEISEFVHDLRKPNPEFLRKGRPPLLERDPVLFWKGMSLGLLLIVIFLANGHPLFSQ